jgi:hypothetical protein
MSVPIEEKQKYYLVDYQHFKKNIPAHWIPKVHANLVGFLLTFNFLSLIDEPLNNSTRS